jgi:hypothetical protein
MESRIEQNGCIQYLKVWYDPALKNWDECIQLAMIKHKIEKAITILCLPKRIKENEHRNF